MEALNHILRIAADSPLLPVVTAVIAGSSVIVMVRESALALRAKRRARYVIQVAKRDDEFKELVNRVYVKNIHIQNDEMEILRANVESRLNSMSEIDAKIVRQGLHQRSRAGSERYLRDLVADNLREVA